MKYFKNTELAKLYSVSEKSVRNWVHAATEGKIDLQLHEVNEKWYVANTAKNHALIETLINKGKKFKNTRGYKAVSPSPEFYKLYNQKQIVDIISNLDIHREIPVQYTYFNSGAVRWDKYTRHLLKQHGPSSLANTISLLELNVDYLDTLLEEYEDVNVVDLGVGNGLPVRGLLEHLQEKGRLKRYIGLDVSKELLNMAKQNIETWFKGSVKFEGYIKDVSYERFDDLLVPESFGSTAASTLNLVMFLGGTLSNFREPRHVLDTIHGSMGKKDFLLFSKKLDTEKSRRYFEMAVRGNQELDLVLRLLNIDESLYTLEQYFDEKKMARELVARLNVAISISFHLHGQERLLEFNKGESILLWRAWHQNAVETLQQFDDSNFELIQASRSKDQDYLLTVSKIKVSGKQGAA